MSSALAPLGNRTLAIEPDSVVRAMPVVLRLERPPPARPPVLEAAAAAALAVCLDPRAQPAGGTPRACWDSWAWLSRRGSSRRSRTRSLSSERVGLIDADLVGLGFAGDELRSELTESPLYRALPAVQDQRVYLSDVYGATAGNNPTMLNVRWNLEQQRPVLERVAAR